MKCEKCNKDIPESIDYCPTCKIEESSKAKKSEQVTVESVKKTQSEIQNNYCRNCGFKLEKNCLECPKCNAPVDLTPESVPENDKKEQGVLYLTLGAISATVGVIFSDLLFICFVITFVMMVSGFMTTKSKFIKVVSVITLVCMLLFVATAILAILACADAISSCG